MESEGEKAVVPKHEIVSGMANVTYNIELRDLFAAHALEHAANHMWNVIAMEMQHGVSGLGPSKDRIQKLLTECARNSYALADKLIEAREETRGK